MDEDDKAIWFERYGEPPFAAYMPTTMKGFWVLFGHIVGISVAVLPIVLLGQFRVIGDPWLTGAGIVLILLGNLSLWRISHRHSAPAKWGHGRS